MSNKEELDFYKISSLILDVGSTALAERIKLDCINKNVSFEDLLNDAINKDKLLHLWQPMRCCNTKCSRTGKKSILNDVQWMQLYCQNSIVGHIKRNAAGRICQSCIHVYSAVNNVTPDGFDITLCSCLLLNICGLSHPEIGSVQKLRGLRNSVFAHAREAKISAIDFNKHWNHIEAEILSISSNCCTSVQNGINTKIRDIKQLPYIDHEVYRTLFNKVLSSYGQELNIVEKITESLDVQTAAINTNTPQYKVQKITEAEVCRTTFYIPTRGMKQGIDSLKKNGVVIFIGKCGSGKTRNSLEILRQVTEGNILPNHKVQHISIENWDLQIGIYEESVVFLEDPLGTINTNDALIKQDQGIFSKVFASVCAGKVKVILTIRSNIYQQHRNHLKRHEIFQDTFIVDLSYGENALSESEKREFISQQCKLWSVEIVRNDEDIETEIKTERDQTMPMKLSQSTIQQIVNSDPPIGYPLRCKQFFQDRKNLVLGERFFCQPTSILLDEMRDMVLSENENERRDIGLLIYMVMSGGKCDPNNLDNGKMCIIAEALCIHSYENIHVRISLNKLKNQHVDFSIKCQQYEFSHISVLESVFISCCSQIPKLIPAMLMNVDIKVLCKFIRTSNENERENETVCMIPEIYFQDLAKRFMTEINSRNSIGFVSHLSLFNDKFVKIFINMLKDTNLVYDENSSRETFFDVICLFDNSKLTSAVLDARLIPEGMIRHWAFICIQFDNINTMKVLIPKMSYEQIRFAFTLACKKMKMAMVQLLFDEGKEDLRQQDLLQGFICMCGAGNDELVDQFIAFGIKDGFDRDFNGQFIAFGMKDWFGKGFNEACKRGNISVVGVLMEKSDIRMNMDPVPGFVQACERKHIEIVEYLLPRFSPTEVRRAVIEACNKSDRYTILKILQNRSVTDEVLVDCLLEICDTSNDFNRTKLQDSDQTHSVLEFSTTPLPYSVANCNHSVPIKTPLTSKIDLFPCPLSNQKSINKDKDNSYETSKSHNQIKGFLIKSIVEFRSNDLKNLNPVFVKACEKSIKEVILVLLKEVENGCISQALFKLYQNGNDDIFNYILSNIEMSYENLRAICKDACVEFKTEFIQSIIYNIKMDINDVLDFFQHALSKGNRTVLQMMIQQRRDLTFEQLYHCVQVSSNHECKGYTVHLIVHERKDLTTEQVNHLLNDYRSQNDCDWNIVCKIIKERKDLTAEHVYQCLRKYCSHDVCNGDNVYDIIQERKDLTTEHVYQCLKEYCSHEKCDGKNVYEIIQEREDLTTDHVLQCLKEYCSHDKCDGKNVFEIIQERKDLKTEHVFQCLKEYCSHEGCDVGIVYEILQEREDLTTEHVFQCLKEYCTHEGCDGDSVYDIIQERKDLTTEHVYQCLKEYCTHEGCDGDSVYEIIQERKDLTTEHVYQCLKEYCSHKEFDAHNVYKIIQERKDLTTEHVFQCLKEYCSRGFDCGHNVYKVIQERKDLTTEHVYQCLKEYCTHEGCDGDSVYEIIQERKDLTTEHVYQCLKEYCTHGRGGYSVHNIIQERKDLTTEHVFQCLKEYCSRGFDGGHNVYKVIQERKDLTTEHVYQCLKECCTHEGCDGDSVNYIIHERKDLTIEHVYQCLKEYCTHEGCYGDSVYEIIQERKDLTTEHVYQCLKEYCSHEKCDGKNVYAIILEREDLKTEHVYQCLKEYCKHGCDGYSVYKIIQEREDLTAEHVYQCLKEYCTHEGCDGDSVYEIIQEREDLTTEHVFQCLKEYCTHEGCDGKNVYEIIQEREDLTTEHVLQCFKEYCSHDKCDAKNVYMIIMERQDLKTEHVFQCLKEYCSHEKCDGCFGNAVYLIISERNDLTTEHVFQCLKEYCTRECCDGKNVYEVIQKRKDLTTEHVYQCLKEYCTHEGCDGYRVYKIIQEQEDLTTEHVFQCLKEYCTRECCDGKNVYEIIQKRKDLTTEHVYQCLKEYCTHQGCDGKNVYEIIQKRKDLTTEHVYQCLKEYCTNEGCDGNNVYIIKIIQKRKDLTTEHVYQCLKEYCTHEGCDGDSVYRIIKKRKDLTTEHVYQCLKKYCTQKGYVDDITYGILNERKDLLIDPFFGVMFLTDT